MDKIRDIVHDPNMVKMETRCPRCRKRDLLRVSRTSYKLWQGGMLIQLAFPGLTDVQREMLTNGYHSRCWGAHQPKEEK